MNFMPIDNMQGVSCSQIPINTDSSSHLTAIIFNSVILIAIYNNSRCVKFPCNTHHQTKHTTTRHPDITNHLSLQEWIMTGLLSNCIYCKRPSTHPYKVYHYKCYAQTHCLPFLPTFFLSPAISSSLPDSQERNIRSVTDLTIERNEGNR